MAVKTSGIVLASRYKYFIDTAGGTDLTDLTNAKFARLGAGFTGTTFLVMKQRSTTRILTMRALARQTLLVNVFHLPLLGSRWLTIQPKNM